MTFKAILVALALLPTYKEDAAGPEKTAQLTAVAAHVAAATQDPELAAFVLSWGRHESNYSLRIGAGKCARWECDAKRNADGTITHRARGPFQVHRNNMSDEKWARMIGIENTAVQVEHAVRMSRWALNRCKKTGDLRIVTAFRVLGGRQCDAPLKGEQERLATFKRIRSAL